ncbi:hypothetical protein [Methanococcus voltae]|uniref:Uncharacterized protein n=1 Tax=Methanococcus voltae (strain ATCC BAA-1334 / A3) TaxID=456320 RepID=D7DS52_METV3|nr:hypothetical protein [Methanococcus voltae]MCS3901487.1 hypothetical protein [Methanococcus voltae]
MSNWFRLEKDSTQYNTAKEYLQTKQDIEEKAKEYGKKHIGNDCSYCYKNYGLAFWITGFSASESPNDHRLFNDEYVPIKGTTCYEEFNGIPSISIEKMFEIQDGLNISKSVVYRPGFSQIEDEIYIKIDSQYLTSKEGYIVENW